MSHLQKPTPKKSSSFALSVLPGSSVGNIGYKIISKIHFPYPQSEFIRLSGGMSLKQNCAAVKILNITVEHEQRSSHSITCTHLRNKRKLLGHLRHRRMPAQLLQQKPELKDYLRKRRKSLNSSKTIPTCDRFSYKKSLAEQMIQMMKPSILPPLPQSLSHKNMMIIKIHRTHMTCDYDKDRQESHGSQQEAKVKKKFIKEPARDNWPLSKVKVIFPNKNFYFARIRQNCRQSLFTTVPPTSHYSSTVRQVTIHEQCRG